jgi:hypothetical protein
MVIAAIMTPLLVILYTAVKAKTLIPRPDSPSPTFFLPTSVFITLVYLVSFWVIFLLLLGAKSLPFLEQQLVSLTFGLFAPLFIWWTKKRERE